MFYRQKRFRGAEMLYVRAITEFTIYQTNCGYGGKAGTIQLKLSCTAKKNNIPYSFLCGHNSYVARRNKTEYTISVWLNANRTDAMTGFIFHSTTIKSSSCGIFHKDRYYNNTAPLFSCNISMQPRSECSYRLTVITKMPSLLTCSVLQGWKNRNLWQNVSRR